MCGFIAILQDHCIINSAAARRALDAIAHRGPDASDEWREGDMFLGHRRLSIIDLTTGDQPMQSSDGRYVIVFNGEIYNFMEVRELLVRAGATFRTRSDTEVILQGYQRWGSSVVERLQEAAATAGSAEDEEEATAGSLALAIDVQDAGPN